MSAKDEASFEVGVAAPRSAVSEWLARSPIQVACLLGVLALGVWTRFHDLGGESIWHDEATTFFRSSFPIPDLIRSSVAGMHIPTYFMIMHHVLPLGDDEWMMRMPSAVFGALKIALVAAAGFIVGGHRVGLVAALILIVSPLHLRYDQEARMYAMQTFGTCLALVGQLWLLSRPQAAVSCWVRRRADRIAHAGTGTARAAWIAWIIGVSFALYMHNTSVLFMLASSSATMLLLIADPELRWRFFWHWVIANLLVLLIWAPWLPTLASQLHSPTFARAEWRVTPDLERVLAETRSLMLGGKSIWLNILIGGFALAGVWQLRRRPLILGALLLLSLSAPLLFYLVSLKKPMFMPRLMLWGTPAFYVLAGQGTTALRRPALYAAALLALAALGLFGLQQEYYAREIKPNWRGIAQVLSKYERADAVAIMASRKENNSLAYYRDRTKNPLPSPRTIVVGKHSTQARMLGLLRSTRHVLYVHGIQTTSMPAPVEPVVKKGRLVGQLVLSRATVDHYEMRGKKHEP